MTNDRYQKIAQAARKARENKKKTFDTVSSDIEENKSISRKEKALLNGRNYFKNTYTPRKAQEYYSGVADFNKKYNEYMKNTGENYRPADEIADWESKRKAAYESDNKKYAVSQALQQAKNNNFSTAKVMTNIDKAGNDISKTNKSMSDYWSQFKSEDEYQQYLKNQKLLAYDVTAAKQRLEQLKANKPAQFSSMGMNDNRGSMTSALGNSDYKKWEQDVATLENEISEAENLQQYVEYMKSPEYKREYEEYNQFMENYNNMNPIEKFGSQAGNLASSTLRNIATGGNAVLEFINNGANTIFGVDTYSEGTLPNYAKQYFQASNDAQAQQERYNAWYNQGLKSDFTNLTGNEELSGFLADTLTNTATAIAEVLPNIALSYATGGLSAAPSMLKATSGLTKTQQISQMVQSAFKGIAKDPNFYYSFIREGGNAYYEAKQSGASEIDAAIAMFSTGLPNAFIEIGGGVEQLPKMTDAKGVKEWVKRFVKIGSEEALEEVKQGVVGQLMAKATYAPEMELFTVNGDGVIDPVRMLQEAYGGFVGGAFGAGVNYAVNKINLQSYNNALKDYKVNTMIDIMSDNEKLSDLQDIVANSSKTDFTELYKETMKAKENNSPILASTYIQLYDDALSEYRNQKTDKIAGYLRNIGFSESEAVDIAPVFLKIKNGENVDKQDVSKIYNSGVALDLVNSIVGTTMSKNQMLYAINNGELDALSTKIIEKSVDADIQKIAENDKRAAEAAEYIGLKRAEIYNDVSGDVVMVGKVNNIPTRLRLVSTDSGAVLLKTAYGDIVDADNVQFSNAATQAIVNLAGDYDTTTAQEFIDGYDGTMTAGDYASLFGKVYNLAMTTNTLSYKDMSAAFAPAMGVNVENAVKTAYMAGRNAVKVQQEEYNARQTKHRAAQTSEKGKVRINNSVDRNLVKNERMFAKFIAKSTGYDVEIVNDERNATQGSFNSTENKIVINLADGNFFATALHETTHFIALNALDEYKAFKDEVMKWLSKNGTLEETLKKYAASYATAGVNNIADLTEEVAANAAESLMKSESFVEDLFTDKDFIEHITKTKSKSFVQRVMERLRSIISAVKQYLSNANPNHNVAKALMKDVNELEKVEKLWVNAFKAAAENRAEVQSSAKENTDTESSGGKYSQTEGEQYTYSKLVTKPDMYIPLVKKITIPLKSDGRLDRSAVANESKKNIRTVGNSRNTDNKVYLHNKDLNRDIKFTTESITHGLRRKSEINAIAALALPEYFSEAICVNELTPRHGVSHAFVLLGAFEYDNNYYYVRAIVNEGNNDTSLEDVNVIYAVNAKREPAANSRLGLSLKEASYPTTGSVISIADFIDNVKGFLGDVLSQDVYDNLQEVRPKTDLKGLRFSLPETREINNIDDLMSELEENSGYTYGLRSINEHDAEMMSRGYLDVSYRWIDNEITDEKLNGSCAVYVDDYMSKEELLKRYRDVVKYYPKNGVDTVLLIRDKHYEWGEDENEVVLGSNGYGADVVAVLKLDDIEEKSSAKLSIPEQSSAEYELLLDKNEDLRKQVETLKAEMKLTKGHKVNPDAVKKLTNKILREYSSKADKEEISARLEQIFNYVAREDADAALAKQAMYDVARRIIDSSESLNTELYDTYKHAAERLRNTTIRVTPAMESEIEYTYGSYQNFRRAYFGRLKLNLQSGTPIDVVYSDLISEFNLGGALDEGISDKDMINSLVDFVEMIKPQAENPYAQDMGTVTADLAQEIFDAYFETPEIKTFADKQQEKLQKAVNRSRKYIAERRANDKAKYEKRLEKVKAENKDKIQKLQQRISDLKDKNDTATKELKAKLYRQIGELKSKNTEKLLAQKAKYQDMAKRKEERSKEIREIAKYRKRIKKNAKDMIRWFNENSDKHHIPEKMRKTVAEFLSTIDFLSDEQESNAIDGKESAESMFWSNAASELYRVMSQYTKTDDDGGNVEELDLELDPDFLPTLDEFIGGNKGYKRISEMDSTQLKELDYLVSVLKRAITTVNKMYLNNMAENVAELGTSTINELDGKKDKKQHGKAVGMIGKLTNIDMLDSLSFFEQLGTAAASIWTELMDGNKRRIWHLKEGQDYMSDLLNGVDVSEWTGKNAKVHEFIVTGGVIKMTTAQVMTLYELWKREQAQAHIMQGGCISVDDTNIKKIQDVSPVRISDDEIINIFKSLTEEQIRIADAMQKFLGENCADWGNEASMEMYGYKKFVEEHYFPIESSDDFVKTNDSNSSKAQSGLFRIKNKGMTKSTVKNANNPIVIRDIFEVFSQHVADMATYNGYVMPLLDAMKWYNYKNAEGSVKHSIQQKYGAQAKEYFINFIFDLNGEGANGAYSTEITSTLTGKMKAASVAANVRVAIQQPTAIARAAAVIDPKYLAVGVAQMVKHPKQSIKEAEQNSALALWKSWGYFDTGLGKSIREVITGQVALKDKIVQKSMILAEYGDKITWGAIWNACKAEIAEKHTDIKHGSAEFNSLVTNRFDDIINRTQVIDTVFHRSQIMRSKDGAVKMASAFMAEPTKTYNLMRNATVKLLNSKNKESVIRFARTTAATLFTAILTAAASAVSDAFRDDDKSKDWAEKYVKNFFDNIIDNVNPLNMIPYFKDIVSALQGYDVERADVAAIAGFMQLCQSLIGKIQDGDELNAFNVTYNMSRYVSQFTGIPIYNLLREADTVIDIFADPLFRTDKTKAADIYDNMYMALLNGDNAAYESNYKMLVDMGNNDKDIETGLRNRLMNSDSKIYESSIAEAAFARMDGNIDLYVEILDELIDKSGLSQDFWVKTINNKISSLNSEDRKIAENRQFVIDNGISEDMLNQMSPDELAELVSSIEASQSSTESLKNGDTLSLYTSTDLATAVQQSDDSAYQIIYDDIVAAKAADIMLKDEKVTEKEAMRKAKSSVKSSLTSKIKPIMQDLYKTDKQKFAKMRTFLLTYCDYDPKTVNNWATE